LGSPQRPAIERAAQSTGLWSYAETMPTVAGVGVAPALQWVVIPMLMLWLARAAAPAEKAGLHDRFKNGAS
jgi:hypothetical protein